MRFFTSKMSGREYNEAARTTPTIAKKSWIGHSLVILLSFLMLFWQPYEQQGLMHV